MRTDTRAAGALIAAIGATASMVMLAGGAQAAPYATTASISVSTTNPAIGANLTVVGEGYPLSASVNVFIESTPVLLRTIQADSTGQFATTITLPTRFTGAHDIVGTSGSSTARASIFIGPMGQVGGVTLPPPGAGAGSPRAGGPSVGGVTLPKTGAQILGLSVLGAVLVAGGVTLVRRRRLA